MKCLQLVACVIGFAAGCSPTSYQHGVPNLTQVDTNVWRSGQITTQEGWAYIAKIAAGRHVHIIKLNFDSEGSDALAIQRGFDIVALSIEPRGDQDVWDDLRSAYTTPDSRVVTQIDTLLSSAASSPQDFYLVHCTHGQDRTGYIIGRHRVLHDGWTKSRAYVEMLDHHFHAALHGVHEAWEQFEGR
jgi:hypothetical protein